MANLKLGSSDVKQLVANYESKQRQLQFELDQTKRMIRSLKSTLPAIEEAESEQAAILAEVETTIQDISIPSPGAKRRGRPVGSKNGAKAKKTVKTPKASKKKEKTRASGYRLSEYDQEVFNALQSTGRAMINAQIVSFIEEEKQQKGENPGAEEIQKMVVRSLQKLANRRDDIKKVPYNGRGMAYALPEWLNGQGVIKKKHAHKE